MPSRYRVERLGSVLLQVEARAVHLDAEERDCADAEADEREDGGGCREGKGDREGRVSRAVDCRSACARLSEKARVSLPRNPPGLEESGTSGFNAASFSATLTERKIALISSGCQIVSLFLKSRAQTHLHSGR